MNVGRRRWPGTSDLQRRAYANVRVCVCFCVCLCVCVCARYRQPGGKRITPIRVFLVPMFGIVKRSLKDIVDIYGQNCTQKQAKSVGAVSSGAAKVIQHGPSSLRRAVTSLQLPAAPIKVPYSPHRASSEVWQGGQTSTPWLAKRA